MKNEMKSPEPACSGDFFFRINYPLKSKRKNHQLLQVCENKLVVILKLYMNGEITYRKIKSKRIKYFAYLNLLPALQKFLTKQDSLKKAPGW
ncbi:hypothetical protein CNR22_13735 [Sphingobacteriaceae bacterium]|nr:hypothetical protein CNR22_13735 [Sphingobacteriaceae bacterium]